MDVNSAKLIGAGLAAMGVIGAGIGIGNVWASWISAVARNPAARHGRSDQHLDRLRAG